MAAREEGGWIGRGAAEGHGASFWGDRNAPECNVMVAPL